MSDEQQSDTETPQRGRPKGSRNKSKRVNAQREPVHHGRHGDADLVNFVYDPDLPGSPFDIDPEILATIARDWGFALEWHIQEIGGKVMDSFITTRARNRWAPVKRGNFGGVLDYLADRDGYMRRDGQTLEGRPVQIQEMAIARRTRDARQQVAQHEAKHTAEGVDVPMPEGGKHPSALAKNRHRRTFEPYTEDKIPE